MSIKRREQIKEMLKSYSYPIKGSDLASTFNVSRQVIVQNIAILRAEGIDVVATSQGYCIHDEKESQSEIGVISCFHKGSESISDEMSTIVDMGARVINVMINHPIYGTIKCHLNIGSRLELEQFMVKMKKHDVKGLAELTGGKHFHTIEAPSKEIFDLIVEKLNRKGYMIEG